MSTAELPLHKMPLCDCSERGAHCIGRQPGFACMAHDNWYTQPCDKGQCPGPMSSDCCHKYTFDAGDES